MGAGGEQTVLYVVAYDIAVDRRRSIVHNTLCGYGSWTQYSLFECWLTRRELLELRAKLGKHVVAAEDSVRFYPLCGACQNHVITVGSALPSESTVLIV